MLHAVYLPVKRLLIFALLVSPIWSATLERMSLDDMIVKSTTIVRGKVTGSWAAFTGAVIYTHYTIEVSETFKGAGRGTVEIMVPGGALNGVQQNFSGSPAMKAGDEFVFFLWTSKTGITWITGLTQGLFTLPAADRSTADQSTDRMAMRAASHELMLDPTTSQAVKDTALSMRLSDLRARIATTLGGGK
jgi:hypothetical protein